jgi:very-short-patch-repair endonuclease
VPLHPSRLDRFAALRAARALAERQDGVLGRRQLLAAGIPRWVVRCELSSGRWQRTGRQTVVAHNGPLEAQARRRIAVLEVGVRAALDGVTALQAAGVTALDDEEIHVITPKSSTPRHPAGVRVHESRLFREEDVVGIGVRRVRPATAAVHAALWAPTDRQATYFLILVVQQRLARARDLHDAVSVLRRHRRRALLRRVVGELAGGVRSLGELDVARDFRRRGLPEPARQVLRRRPSGTQYLDCELPEYGVTIEIDGAGHDEPWQRLADLVRDIATAAEGRVAVRLPLLTYSLDRDRVLDALADLLASRGWRDASAA